MLFTVFRWLIVPQHCSLWQFEAVGYSASSDHPGPLVPYSPRYLHIVPLLSLFPQLHHSLGVNITAAWDPNARACVIVKTNTKILAATFVYSMCFDLIVFLLNLYKLYLRRERETASMGASRLGKMIFGDGLIYFFIAYVYHLFQTILINPYSDSVSCPMSLRQRLCFWTWIPSWASSSTSQLLLQAR